MHDGKQLLLADIDNVTLTLASDESVLVERWIDALGAWCHDNKVTSFSGPQIWQSSLDLRKKRIAYRHHAKSDTGSHVSS